MLSCSKFCSAERLRPRGSMPSCPAPSPRRTNLLSKVRAISRRPESRASPDVSSRKPRGPTPHPTKLRLSRSRVDSFPRQRPIACTPVSVIQVQPAKYRPSSFSAGSAARRSPNACSATSVTHSQFDTFRKSSTSRERLATPRANPFTPTSPTRRQNDKSMRKLVRSRTCARLLPKAAKPSSETSHCQKCVRSRRSSERPGSCFARAWIAPSPTCEHLWRERLKS
mmetsp:Transcript_46304/g.128846  ORF Transcript_46304/g.128846 Transcript_46304/m.128846 type:complete len:225 (-) Transcript_46304:1256-1930(-)